MPLDTSRIEELFHAAQQIQDPEEQRTWLATACAGDTAVQERVASLLRAAADASQFLNRLAVEHTGALAQGAGAITQGYDPASTPASGYTIRFNADQAELLTFLQPSARPDSLGRLGHYEILEVIGQGGFGIVLRAFDEKLHRVVALKVLAPELAANGSARKRFVREARTAAAVKNEHVVGIYEVDENAQPPYLAMEMIDGKSLQEKIDQQGPLGLKEILRIGLQMAEGLAAAHKQGLVHRDIKPANILLENGVERVKITDFGLARAVDDASVTQSGVVAGTPMYMSPEQAEGLPIDHRSDLFSLGTVLYAMCTGHPAFRASGTHAVLKRVIDAAPRPIRETNPEIPDWLAAIIAKLHAKNPDNRFATAHEVAELLGGHLAHEQNPGQVQRPPLPFQVQPPKSDRRESSSNFMWPLATVILGCLATLVCFTLMFGIVTIGIRYLRNVGRQVAIHSPSVLSVELNDKRIEFRIDDHGPNLTAVSNYQIPLEAGEHRVWLKLGDIEFETYPFITQSGKQADLTLSIEPGRASARFDGQFIKMRQLGGTTTAVDLGTGAIELPATNAGPAVSVYEQAIALNGKWVPLFNGQDLTGWKTHPDEPGDWKVAGGAIVGASKPSYLFSERGDYTDFHLRCEVQINQGGDGGIVCRSPFVLAGKLGMPAYEAQIFPGKPRVFGWGTGAIGTTTMRLGWHPLKEAFTDFPTDTWVSMEVIVLGNAIETRIEGKSVVEFTDPDRMYKQGHIALQQAGEKTCVQFRKLEIKELAPVSADSAEVRALREAVAALEKNQDTVRRQVEAAIVSPLALIKADCEWIEARIRLAEARTSLAEVIWLFREELIPKITEEQRLVSERVKAGVESESALNAVEVRLAEVKVRFVRACTVMLEASNLQSQRQAPTFGRP